MNTVKYSWIPDVPDQRDFMYGLMNTVSDTLPEKVDLRQFCSKIESQGNLGSCTAQSLVALIELLENKDKVQFTDMSRLFVYYNERALQNTIRQDSGASLRVGIKALNKYGVCHEKNWPYTISKYKTKPTAACFKDALNHRVSSYMRLNTLQEMRQCLTDGFPFVFGISVYDSFESDEVEETGMVPMPGRRESCLGGHALACVGFDDNMEHNGLTGYFIVRNSWGADWGDSGYCYMPYDYLANRDLSDDFWTIRAGQGF